MATPAQSINAVQGQIKLLEFEHETTFADYTANLLIGKRRGEELLDLVKTETLQVSGNLATGKMLIDMPPGVYDTQLVLTDSETEDPDIILGPQLIVKAKIGGWPESP